MKINKRFSSLLFILLITFIMININSFAKEQSKNILILGSYNAENRWEQSVIKGIKSNSTDLNIEIDFLDAVASKSDLYNESILNVLNLKYMNEKIDCIITIDDEALNFARNNLFNENSFIYKKNIVFVGINSYLNLTNEESKYITGVLEYQDNIQLLELILKLNKSVQNIYLLVDGSIYGNMIKENMKDIEKFISKSVDIHILEANEFYKIENQINDISDKDAIILAGMFKDIEKNQIIDTKDLINKIKSETNAQIYSKLIEYIENGAIGGIVNDGEKLGKITTLFVQNLLSEANDNIISPAYNTFNTPIFNFKALRYYNINPGYIPNDSVVIDKGPFNLLLPRYLEITVWVIVMLLIISILLVLILYHVGKKKTKKNQELLTESIERHEIKTDFIMTISHELRTPLNIIINSNKLLKLKIDKNKYDPVFFSKQLDLINKNSNRLLRLINNIIDVSRIESGHIDAIFANENIVDVIEDSTMSVIDLGKSYGIEIIFDTEEEEIITAIDRNKIERIMLNLLSNSIKFTNNGGHILVSVKKDNENVLIEVKDDGIGMSDELKNHLFEKFRKARLYPSLERANEGSGLGLFIVQGLVKVHNGTIKVESELGKGTTFIIKIPQGFVDKEGYSNGVMGIPLDYTSKIELSDIYNEKE
ncbi:MAG: sensor histidine kinase [Peptostreptococcaceae bacterium]